MRLQLKAPSTAWPDLGTIESIVFKVAARQFDECTEFFPTTTQTQ